MKINKVLKILLITIFVVLAVSVISFKLTVSRSHPTSLYESSEGIDVAKSSDYDNCIILEKDNATQIINRKKTEIGYDRLEQVMGTQTDQLKREEVKIIYTKQTAYKNVLQMLDILTKTKIARYKLLKA